MSQTQTQSVNPIGPDGVVSCFHGQKVWLQTSRTGANPNRKFFTCYRPRGSSDRCSAFFWLSDLRLDPNWDEARFRLAYNIPPGQEIEGVPLSQKRQIQGETSFGPSQSPKRVRRNDDHEEYNPVTPTRNGGDRRRGIPLTPPSTSRVNRELAEVPPSPSEETARRRDLRIRDSHSLHLQNFEGGMDEISPLTSRESPQSPPGLTTAQELECLIASLNYYPDLIRKLERKASADRSSLEGRMRRVQQLETEVSELVRENETLHKEIARLRRDNDRLLRSPQI